MEKLTNIIEAILFAAGDAIPMDLLREKLDITKKELDDAVRQLCEILGTCNACKSKAGSQFAP